MYILCNSVVVTVVTQTMKREFIYDLNSFLYILPDIEHLHYMN